MFSEMVSQYVDIAVITESVLLAVAWYLFIWEKPKNSKAVIKQILIFIGIFLLDFLIRLSFIVITVSKGYGAFSYGPIMMYFFYTLVGYVFVRIFGKLKRTTTGLVTAMMFGSVCALNSIGGQLSYIVGMQIGGGILEGVVRCLASLFLIPIVCYLKKLDFNSYRFVPVQGVVMLLIGDLVLACTSLMEGYPRQKESYVYYIFLLVFTGIYVMMLSEIRTLSAMCKEHVALMRLQMEKQRYAGEMELYSATESSIRDLRSIRHDLKNQYGYMRILLAEKRYEELETYFSDMTEHLPEQLQYVDCGNKSMNTMLNMMFMKAKRYQVTMEHQLVVPPVLPFADEDLCSLVSNLLDNAIEECKRLQDLGQSGIGASLDIHPQGSYLIIQCMNSTDKKELYRNDKGLKTTKRDKSIHGYGTNIVSKISEKYNGMTEYRLEEGKFVAKVMLDIMTGEESND